MRFGVGKTKICSANFFFFVASFLFFFFFLSLWSKELLLSCSAIFIWVLGIVLSFSVLPISAKMQVKMPLLYVKDA